MSAKAPEGRQSLAEQVGKIPRRAVLVPIAHDSHQYQEMPYVPFFNVLTLIEAHEQAKTTISQAQTGAAAKLFRDFMRAWKRRKLPVVNRGGRPI